MPRIGAEYHRPNDEGSQVVATARRTLLDRIEDVAPEVVAHLREKVLPVYRDAWEDETVGPGRASWERSPAFWMRLPQFAERHPDVEGYQRLLPLHDALFAWADTYNLIDEWLLDDALHTLHFWVRWPRALEVTPGRFHAGGAGGAVPELDAPELEIHPWEPTLETWASYQDQARETFESWLRDYRAAGEAWADALGMEAAPEKRPRKDESPALHFEWVARYQCQGWSYGQIADHYDRGNRNPSGHSGVRPVSRAIRDLADLMGLTLRDANLNQYA